MSQERPIEATTLQTTDTSANSLLVGCAVGSTTCTGGIKAGPLAVGTISAGLWNGTKIGLAYGGTNADLSATGGTSQFLRQNSAGATVTVVRPAVADLSDASNIALLNAVNAFSAFGAHAWSAGGTGGNTITLTNSTSGTANYAAYSTVAGTNAGNLYAFSQGYTTSGTAIASSALVQGTGAGGLSLQASDAAGVIRLYTGGASLRWGVNAAGDWIFGASSHLADSSGTPAITSSFGGSDVISGTDYAFKVSLVGAGDGDGTVTFGHTFSSAPICVATIDDTAGTNTLFVSTTTTTTVRLKGTWANSSTLYVLCRGY